MLYGINVLLHNVLTIVCLNPYFFGKCSTAYLVDDEFVKPNNCLNPYFVGKCSTAYVKFTIEECIAKS